MLSRKATPSEANSIRIFASCPPATPIGTRRADDLGGEIELPKDERSVNRWFNTAAFAAAPNRVWAQRVCAR